MGGRIAYARITRGLTQDDLAKRVGVTKGAVSQWESGKIKDLTADTLLKLADAVEASERWLLLGKDHQGKDIPMGRPRHLDAETADLVDTYIQLPERVRDELLSDAHKYLRITAPQQPTRANPFVAKHKKPVR